MSARTIITLSACLEWLRGIHQPGDDYRIALYRGDPGFGKHTRTYGTAGEAVGDGYEAGGRSLVGFAAGIDDEDGFAWVSFDNAEWPNARFSADVALIYNKTKGNRAIAVLELGETISASYGPFTVELPDHVVRLR